MVSYHLLRLEMPTFLGDSKVRKSFFYSFRGCLYSLFCFFCFFGCEMYDRDMLSSTSKNSKVEQVEVIAEKQINDFGYICIPVDSSPVISAFISNPQNYDSTIGTHTDGLSSIRVSRSVLSLASVSQDEQNFVQVTLQPAGPDLEHTDFTISFVPISEDVTVVENQGRSVTLRYNTPPAVPLGVTVDLEGNYSFLSDDEWGIIYDGATKNGVGYVYWAWPQGMTITGGASEKDKNCAASFVLNNRAYTPKECATGKTITAGDGTVYDVYKLQIGNVPSVELYAKDVESIRGKSLVSGIKSHEITFSALDGFFEDTEKEKYVFYCQNGLEFDFSLVPIPAREGFTFLGWTADSEVYPANHVYDVKSSVQFQALWEDEALWDEVRELSGTYNREEGTVSFLWSHPLEKDFVQTRLSSIDEEGRELQSVLIPSSKMNHTLNLGDEDISGFRFQTISSTNSTSKGLVLYTLTYVLDDSIERVLVQEGMSHPEIEVVERDGFEFKGWFLNDGEEAPFDLSQEVTKSLSLYPKWEKIEPIQEVATED